MIKLIEIEIEGFRSFQDRQLISFEQSGITLIAGEHTNEDTTSGIGKSSIPEAIAFAFGFCDLPATELKGWNSSSIYVRLKIQKDSDFIDIVRSPKLHLIQNGVAIETMAKDAEQRLQAILGVSPEVMQLLTYRPQRTSNKFIDLTDSEQKVLLTGLLGLDQFEKAADTLSGQLSSVQIELASNSMLLKQLNSIPSIDITETKHKLTQTQSQILEYRSKIGDSTTGIEISKLNQEINQYETEIDKLNTITRKASQASYENSQIKPKVEIIFKELTELKGHKCPTCSQHWDQNQEAIKQRELHLAHIKNLYQANQSVITAAEPYKDPVHINQLRQNQNLLRQKIADLQSPGQQTQAMIGSLSQLSTQLKNQIDQAEMSIHRKQQIEQEDQELALKEHLLSHGLQILGRQGFLGVIFDEVLREIQLRANRFMENIPNINTLSLEFSSESVTKSGKVNKKINTVIWKQNQAIKKKSLSGGQQAAVELAVDLALAETIRSRSGINLGWLVLDESMDGLDASTKAAIIETMRKENKGLVILIDHATEIKEMCDNVIKVQYDGQKSWIG